MAFNLTSHSRFLPHRLPLLFLILSFVACSTTPAVYAQKKKTAARAEKKTSSKSVKSTSSKTNKKTGKTEKTAAKSKSSSKSEKQVASKSRTAKDKRNSKDDARTAKASGKSNKKETKGRLSKRELAAKRREEERRRREEAARRAELARQARLAAIARVRAANQALRDETIANISQDDTTGEDLEVRRVAVDALGGLAGTVVVMDPQSGRVYTVVNQDWALRRGFKPCSTIKLLTGLAGVTDGVIAPVETVAASNGRYRLDLTDSLAYSNNPYFQTVGGRVGFNRMIEYARELGLGERTGINHPNESPGRLPLFKEGYAVNHMSSHGDDFAVTPIQLATMVSAIANGGKLLTPHLPRTPEEDVKFKREVRRELKFTQEQLRRLVPGMIGAVNYGTARSAYDATQVVCGKTGSCIDNGTWVGLFASYAPVDDPRLAVVVITKSSSARGRIAAGVAGRIYRTLNYRFGRRNGGATPQLANAPVAPGVAIPRPKVDAQTARAISSEEAEADAATAEIQEAEDAATSATDVRQVIMPVEKTTRSATNPNSAAQNSSSTATRQSSSPQSVAGQRPRRVLSTEPQVQRQP